jgi:glutathionylspermidine synthase
VLPRGRFEFGAPDDVVIRDGRAWLHDRPLDLVFRYYPMDWLADERFDALIELVAADRIQMLPPAHALIPQSKAFLALLWELVERGFFPLAEATAIRDHVPLTTLDAQRFRRTRHVIKPYLEREGQGVRFSSRPSRRDRGRRSVAEVVHQEALDLATGRVPVLTGHGWSLDTRSLVFGVYVAGEEIAGIYTRAGARVTGREAVFVPTLLRS